MDIHPVEWDPATRVASTTTMHLTDFVAGFISMQKVFTQMGDVIYRAAGQTFPRPSDCESRVQTPDGVQYTVRPVTRDVAWPCLSVDRVGGIRLDLHSNSPLVYRVRTDPPRPGEAAPGLDMSNIMTQLVYDIVYSADRDREESLLPGGSVAFRYLSESPPLNGELVSEAILNYIDWALFALDMVLLPFPNPSLESALEQAELADCIAGVVESSLSEVDFTEVFAATANCIGPILATGPGLLVGKIAQIVLGGFPLLTTMWRGAVHSAAELAGLESDTRAHFEISARRPDSEYIGTWSGQVTGDAVEYSVTVNIREQDNILVGDVDYPELGCGGTWTQFLTSATTATFTEVINYGNRRCIDESTVAISPISGNLHYFIDYGSTKLNSEMRPAA